MDAVRTVKNNRGIALVYLAILLVALIAISGLVVDLGYMYVTKSQMQNAADAGALAGVYKIMSTANPTDTIQTAAKLAAKDFASRNTAATTPVNLSSKLSSDNELAIDNDIAVGFWNFTTFHRGQTPINAIEVRPKRVKNNPDSSMSAINSFFAQVVGFDSFDVSARAIAALPPLASSNISMCRDICSGCYFNRNDPYAALPAQCTQELILEVNPLKANGTNWKNNFAFTSLLRSPSSADKIGEMICSPQPIFEHVCGKNIWATQGGVTVALNNLESVMYNPAFGQKTECDGEGSGKINGWTVLAPITGPDPSDPSNSGCPPGESSGVKTQYVEAYAKIHIKAVCEKGGSAGCPKEFNNVKYDDKCNVCNNRAYENKVVIDSIQCFTCSDIGYATGQRPTLVK